MRERENGKERGGERGGEGGGEEVREGVGGERGRTGLNLLKSFVIMSRVTYYRHTGQIAPAKTDTVRK